MKGARQRDNNREGSGKTYSPEPSYIVIGRVLRPHGVRGELRIEIITAYPERLWEHEHFYLAHPDTPDVVERYSIEGLRPHKNILLLKLEGCNERTAAEQLRGMLVQIPFEDAIPLEEGEYYHFQLVGMRVETESGEWLGRVTEVLDTGANDVYVVHGPRGEVLLPAIDSVVLELDIEAGKMIIHLLPGMLTGGKSE